jgi:predicted metalloprotease with PDZ domain
MRRLPSPCRSCLFLLMLGLAGAALARESLYELDLSDRHAQDLGVTVTFDEVKSETLDIHLPVWRTGLYRQLDPVGTLSGLEAENSEGEPLAIEQTDTSSWRIRRTGSAAGSVRVRYNIYANSLGDRTRHVDAEHAFVNPALTLIWADGFQDAPLEVRMDLPRDWRLASGLAQPRPGVLVAPDYDRLVDSPMEAGTFDRVAFEAAGIDIEFAIHGTWDGDAERLERDLRALVETTVAVYGEAPVDRYLFITHSRPGFGGGTEYFNSTLVHTDPEAWWDEEEYRGFLSLLAHEFFHTWNVKRSRPAGIARYDYLEENLTELLWVAEGLTSYYDEILLVRAGLMTVKQWRETLAENIDSVVDRPGYRGQSLADASLAAWTKGFHPGADRAPDKPNRTVSFYSQGALLGLVLDLRIRSASDGEHSLDDLMRGLYRDFPLGSDGFTHADVRARVAALGGEELGESLDAWTRGNAPLPLAEVLKEVGWKLDRAPLEDDAVPVRLGLSTRPAGEGVRVRSAELEGPAWQAGINAGDELIALAGARITDGDAAPLLRRHQPGETVELALFRDGSLRRVPVTLAPARADHRIEPVESTDPATEQRRRNWLGGHEEAAAGERE